MVSATASGSVLGVGHRVVAESSPSSSTRPAPHRTGSRSRTSAWGRSTSPEVGPYCATKWAIEGYTQSLAQELPRGLAAVAVNPGVIDTDMLRTCWADEAAGFENAQEWARRAVPFFAGLGERDNGASATV